MSENNLDKEKMLKTTKLDEETLNEIIEEISSEIMYVMYVFFIAMIFNCFLNIPNYEKIMYNSIGTLRSDIKCKVKY